MKLNKFGFKAYGVKTVIETNDPQFLGEVVESLSMVLPDGFVEIDSDSLPAAYRVIFDKKGHFELYIDGELETKADSPEYLLPFFLRRVRLRIAERADSKVFIHAGAVVWDGAALIFPANSFQGKTTLVAELVKHGALYLSDEYAVFDADGMVHAFPKTLSVRGLMGEYVQTEIPVEQFGKAASSGPFPPGLVLFTEFADDAVWDPVLLTRGQGMLEILSHTIPIRYNPKFSLEVLNKVLNRAIIAKSKRADSKHFAKVLVEFVERHLN